MESSATIIFKRVLGALNLPIAAMMMFASGMFLFDGINPVWALPVASIGVGIFWFGISFITRDTPSIKMVAVLSILFFGLGAGTMIWYMSQFSP